MTVSMITLHGPRTDLTADAVDTLRSQLRGPLLSSPSGAGIPMARDVFNAMNIDQPSLVAQCSGTADVIDAVNFARRHDLRIAVRGGGHSVSGLSSIDNGMLIDLSAMRSVQVDPDQRVAHVQGGALWADVDRETQAYALATPGGVVSNTGVAGLTLGGGYGWLRRKFGLSCDNVVKAQVVCADGEVRGASAEHEPDLFWAIRGGGGNFGIVTSFTFQLHPLGPTVAFVAPCYPVEQLPSILRGWRDYVSRAPERVTSTAMTITFPAAPGLPDALHNQPCAVVAGVYAGDPTEGMEVMRPLRELGTPRFDLSAPTPYVNVQSALDALFPRKILRAYWKSQYLDQLSDEAIDLISSSARARPAPLTMVNTYHMGGAIGATGPEETAFAERSARFMVSIDGNWTDPSEDVAMVRWVRTQWERLRPVGTGRVYLNFTGLADEPMGAGVPDALGRNLRRLAAIKAAYDPGNFFRHNNNIAPARS